MQRADRGESLQMPSGQALKAKQAAGLVLKEKLGSLTVLGSLRALRNSEVPIALVPLPGAGPTPENGPLPSFSFCVPCISSQQLSTDKRESQAASCPQRTTSLLPGFRKRRNDNS